MAQDPNLLFLGVGRVKDCALLAKCSDCLEETEVKKIEDVFGRLMAAAKVKLGPNQRMRLQWNSGSVAFLMDESSEFLYAVVTANLQYPEKWAFHLLGQFMSEMVSAHGGVMDSTPANSLSEPMRPQMVALLSKYQNPEEFDKVATATRSANMVNEQVNRNVQNVTKNMEQLTDIHERSGQLVQHARGYYNESHSLKNKMWWKSRKYYIIGGAILFIWLMFMIFSGGSDEPKKDEKKAVQSIHDADAEAPVMTTLDWEAEAAFFEALRIQPAAVQTEGIALVANAHATELERM